MSFHKPLSFLFFLCSFFAAKSSYGQAEDIELMDSLYLAGRYSESLDLSQQVINEFERLTERSANDSLRYIRAIGFGVFNTIRLNRFNEVEPLARKILDHAEAYTKFPGRLSALDLGYGEYQMNIVQNFDQAIFHFTRANELLETGGAKESRKARARTYLGILHSRKEQYDSATLYFEKALESHTNTYGRYHYMVAGIHTQMSNNYMISGDYLAGLRSAKEMLILTTYEQDTSLIDEPYYEEASLMTFFRDFYELAKEEKLLERYHPADAEIGRVVANLLFYMGNLNLADDYADLSETAFVKHNKGYQLIDLLVLQANIHYGRNQVNAAIDAYRKAEDMYAALGLAEHEATAWVYHNLGLQFTELSLSDSAIYYNRKALNLRKKVHQSPSQQIASSLLNMAIGHSTNKSYDSAAYYYNLTRLEGYADQAVVDYNQANTLIFQSELEASKTLLHQAKRGLQSESSVYYYRINTSLANIHTLQGQYDSAQYYIDQNLQQRLETSGATPLALLEAQRFDEIDRTVALFQCLSMKVNALYKAYENTSDPLLLDEIREAVRLSKPFLFYIRSNFVKEADDLSFTAIEYDFIHYAVLGHIAMWKRNDDPKMLFEAMAIADLSKTKLLKNRIQEVRNETSSNPLLTAWLDLTRQLRTIKVKLKAEEIRKTISESNMLFYQEKQASLEEELNALVQQISRENPSLFSLISDQLASVSFKQAQRQLNKRDEVIIKYFVSDSTLHRFFITDDAVDHKSMPYTVTMQNAIVQIVDFVSQPAQVNEQAYQQYLYNAHMLYSTLLPDLSEVPADHSVIIIPDQELSELPFDVLLSAKTESAGYNFKNLPYSLLKHQFSYAYSLSYLIEIQRRSSAGLNKDKLKIAAWAPFYSEAPTDRELTRFANLELTDLPGSSKEVEAIEQLFDTQSFLGAAASERSFKQNAMEADIIHLATHAMVNPEDYELSGLLFKTADTDSVEDGQLHFFELDALPLKARLAVLSACQTGKGELIAGEGIMNLAKSFSYAGTSSVLVSLWLASDQSTAQIMGDFYTSLKEGSSISGSLQTAKINYLQATDNLGAHPFYWSHLVLNGDNGAVVAKSSLNPGWIPVLFIMLMAIVVDRRRRQREEEE